MRGLPPVDSAPNTRTRRWDAVVVGGALPGLVAAVRLGMRGARVLVVEEAIAARRFPGLREPWWISGAGKETVLGTCLRGLGVPLIDQRRIELDPIAFQVVLPEARVDVGAPGLCVDEWVAWGLAKPQPARRLANALAEGAEIERDLLLEAKLVRGSQRAPRTTFDSPTGAPARPRRKGAGSPPELDEVSDALRAVLGASVRALSNLAASEPSPQARSRLLGAPLEGAGSLRGGAPWLRDILRRRIESLYGEFRTLKGGFRLVSSGGQPGLAPDASGESGEVWVGRALVLNAPLAILAGAVAQDPAPECLAAPAATRRRLAIHLNASREVLPEGMASRVILLRDPAAEPEGTNVVTLRSFPGGEGRVDLVASAVVDTGADAAGCAREIEEAVLALMPFAGEQVTRSPDALPTWDDDAWLVDPSPGAGWPGELELRLGTRQPIHALDRSAVAGLGFEGDLLLGWRGGDAIAADLA